ncbi:MAG TPA: hypothetical protein VNF51_02995 [Candidatus Paceibacterota bacterium]|nr:hypothetical protein [Candidatus Paceibacterota bacterium]
MRNAARLIAILASITLFSACATQGKAVKIGLTMPDGERATIVAHNQSVPDWMLAQDKMKLNYLVLGDVSKKQLAAVAEAEHACRIFTDTVRPSNMVAVLSSGVLYATAGYVGVGVGAKVFAGVSANQYAHYGAWASGVGGMANGMATLGGQTYTFENCGREVLALFPGYDVKVLQKSPY